MDLKRIETSWDLTEVFYGDGLIYLVETAKVTGEKRQRTLNPGQARELAAALIHAADHS